MIYGNKAISYTYSQEENYIYAILGKWMVARVVKIKYKKEKVFFL
jgi:hypothetical protein